MFPLLRIATRNVVRHRRRSTIAFSAVFFALAIVVTMRGLINGMSDSIREATILGQTGALQIHRAGYLQSTNGGSLELDVPTDEAFMAKVRSTPGVAAAAARLSFGAMVNVGDTTTPALLHAVDPDGESRVCPRRFEMITSGKGLAEASAASSLLSSELAAKLGIREGERATLMAGDRDGALNALDVDYVGSYGQSGLGTPDKKIGFVRLALAQKVLRMPDRATEITVGLTDMTELEHVKARLRALVGAEYEVSTWREIAPWVDEAIATNHRVLAACTSIFLFVALLGVVNTMLMSAFERTREIGTMLSMGVRRRQVLALFLTEGALLGLVGGLCGSAVGGSLIAWLARHGLSIRLSNMAAPFHIRPWLDVRYVLVTLGLAVGGAVLAALWPALRASRLRPVEALASV